MHHNGMDGLGAEDFAIVGLHGTKTDIHSNNENGIWAVKFSRVSIHLHSQHNTSHDNKMDRKQNNAGSIANIKADGKFGHIRTWNSRLQNTIEPRRAHEEDEEDHW